MGISPTPSTAESRGCPPWSHAQSRAGSRAPLRLFPEPSPLARADFASSPPRRTPAPRAFHGRRGSRIHRRRHRRRDSADCSWNIKGVGRGDGETRATKRVLKFRRLHLVHSSAVAARQTVAVTALILEFSLSLPRFLPPLPSLSLVFFLLLAFLVHGVQPADFLRKISARHDIGFLREVHSDFTRITKYFITKYFCTQNNTRFYLI